MIRRPDALASPSSMDPSEANMKSQSFWASFSALVEMIKADSPLDLVLQEVANAARAVVGPPGCTAVLLYDADATHLRLAASSGLPESIVAAVHGFLEQASHAEAAITGQPSIVSDVQSDLDWVPYLDLARVCQVRACWRFPLLSEKEVLGAIAIYFADRQAPTSSEMKSLRYLATIASAGVSRVSRAGTAAPSALSLTGRPPAGHRSGEGVGSVLPYLDSSFNPLL